MAFKRGFKAVDQEKKRQERVREERTKQLWKFYLPKDGDEADITFLTEEPINFEEHNVRTFVKGKERFEGIPCIGKDCKYCEDGEKTSFKSAWLIVDHREYEYKDKNGKKQTGKDQIRVFIHGIKVASQLDRLSKKYGILNRTLNMVRMGSDTSTTYTFEREGKKNYSPSEIEELLPEALREEYDGTTESLYDLLENQIIMLAGQNDYSSDKEDDEDDEDEDYDDSLVDIDDEEEEDEEDERPRKNKGSKKVDKKSSKTSSGKKSKTKFGNKKRVENKVKKTSVKGLLNK